MRIIDDLQAETEVMSALILDESQLRQCASMDSAALDAIEQAFTWVAQDRVEMPPIMHISVNEESDFDIKSAYVRGVDHLAVKIASGFFGNAAFGLPNCSAMVVVLSAKTGACEAVMLDNGYLTDLRTGLAGAVAAKYLAVENPRTVGVVGTGVQARFQVHALRLVRNFDRLLVHGRTSERIADYVREMSGIPGLVAEEAPTLEALVRESEVVITTTQSQEPLIQSEWLHPGLHITAMGSDLAGKQELHPKVLSAADLLVCDRLSQCRSMGELQHAASSTAIELGEITSGLKKGRTSAEAITVCDLTGMGVQDTAIANAALKAARALDIGCPAGS